MDCIGYYITPDDALCADCAPPGFTDGDYSEWAGVAGWGEPSAIMSDSESDSPTHCARCGELIEHRLTPDGYEYVAESLARALDGNIGQAIGTWMAAYGADVDLPAEYMAQFTAGYCQAMLWANLSEVHDTEGTGTEAKPNDWRTPADGWQLAAFTPASRTLITADCENFVRQCWLDLASLPASYGRSDNGRPDPGAVAECAGIDFALSRNRHGAGFFDRGLGDLGDRLQEAAKVYGTSDAWFDYDETGCPVHLDDE